MYQLGEVDAPAAAAGSFDWLQQAVVPLVQGYSQIQLIRAQTDRMKRGLAPLDATNYSTPMRVQTTIAPGEGTNRTLMLAGGIALAALLMLQIMGRRR